MNLLVDCDPGNGLIAADVDDGIALGLLWATPSISVELITTVDGNVPAATGAEVAIELARLAGARTGVAAGVAAPAVESGAHWRELIDRRAADPAAARIWGRPDIRTNPGPRGAISPEDATTALEHALMTAAPGHYAMLAIGPLTTLAALERRVPGILGRLSRLVILGGAFTGPAGIRELNFALDPEAAETVLGSGAAATILPLDVSRRSWLTPADVEAMSSMPHPLVRELARTAAPWVTWIATSRDWPGANFHDVLAAAILLDPSLAEYRTGLLGVDTSQGPDRSRPVWLDRSGPHTVVTGFDHDSFMTRVLSTFASWPPAERHLR